MMICKGNPMWMPVWKINQSINQPYQHEKSRNSFAFLFSLRHQPECPK